jgi:hypothetical protein
MNKSLFIFSLALTLVFSFYFISAATGDLSLENQLRLEFNHVIFISNIVTNPENIAPGQNFTLKFTITNEGSQFVRDVITKVSLPSEITTYNDVSTVKTAQLDPSESLDVSFNLIVKPTTAEGVYNLPILVDYINHVGDERQENETLGIIVSSKPLPLVEIKSTDIYKGNELGKVTINVINNGVANIKFLTLELLPSKDYEIISSDLSYIGSLDSDDSSAVDFRIKVKDDSSSVVLPLLLTYKDAINRDYAIQKNVTLQIQTAKDLGIQKSNAGVVWLVIIILAIVAYVFYRRYKAKKLALANKNKFK